MAEEFRKLLVPSLIGALFFLFGFFVTAQVLDMTLRDIVVGLVAGVCAGIVTLASVLHQSRLNALLSPQARLRVVTRR